MAQVAEQPEAQQAVLGSGDACEDQETLAASLGVDDSSIQQPMDASAGPSTALAAQSSDADEAAPVSAPLGEQEVAEQHVGEPTGMETCKTEPVQPAAGEHLQDSKQQEVLQEAATDNATVTPVEAAAAATGLPAETDAAVDDAAVPSAVDGADPEQVTSSSSVTDVPSHAEAADAAGAAAEGSMQGIVQEAAAAPQLDPPTEAAAAAQPDDAPAATEAVPPAATAAGSDAAVTAEAQQAAAAEVQQAGVADAPAAMLDQEAAAAPSHSRQPNKAYFVDGVRVSPRLSHAASLLPALCSSHPKMSTATSTNRSTLAAVVVMLLSAECMPGTVWCCKPLVDLGTISTSLLLGCSFNRKFLLC